MNVENDLKSHSLHCESRGLTKISGVADVEYFNETEILVHTHCGELLIKGESLHVDILDVENEKMQITGSVSAFVYTDKKDNDKSLLSRIFK